MILLTPSYWFNLTAIPFMPWLDRVIALTSLAMFTVGLGLAIYAFWAKDLERISRKLLKRYTGLLVTAGLFGLLLWFMTSQGVPLLSMRALWIVWLAIFAYWAYTILAYQLKELPRKKDEREKAEALRKWWPKAKK